MMENEKECPECGNRMLHSTGPAHEFWVCQDNRMHNYTSHELEQLETQG